MDIMIGDLTASAAMTQSLTPAQIGSLLSQDSDEDLLGGAAAKKEREIIESNRVKLANYIHDVTTLFPLLRQEGIFSRDDVEIIEAPVTTTAKVDKFLDVLLRKGPNAIGVFHEALSSHYRHLFNYLAQLFTQAGLNLPASRQMKDEGEEVNREVADPMDIRHSRSNSTYRSGSRSVTIRKRLEVMSRQCEMMENEKIGLQKALSDREVEISSLLSTKEHVQVSLNNVQGKYQELLSQLAHWRAALESDDAVQQWMVERENIQREYDQMEQDYNLQCSELNAARERISLLLQQLERSEKIVAITQENSQKEKDFYKHRISVLEGEVKRLLDKLDHVVTRPLSREGKANGECPEVRCEKLQHELEQARDHISTQNDRLEVLQREKMQAYDERDEIIKKQYVENMKRKSAEKEIKQLRIQIESLSNCSDSLYSPQTSHKAYPMMGGVGTMATPPHHPMRHASVPGEDMMPHRLGAVGIVGGVGTTVKVENQEVFMPAPRSDSDLGMKLEQGVVVRELKEGSLPHKHGVRLGDEIYQVNKFTLYGDNPLDFFNRLLKNATEPVALMLRRQVQVADTGRPYNTLPVSCVSPRGGSRPISPCLPSLPIHPPPSSSIFPLSPQLGATTLSRKSPSFQPPPTAGVADSPVSGTTTLVDTPLDGGKTLQPRVSTDGMSNSTHSTNKDSSCSSSSDEDGERTGRKKNRPRMPVIIPQQKSQSNRYSTASEQDGIVTSPTERTSVWRDKRLTKISTIDSGFEFPFTEDGQQLESTEILLHSSEWDVVESPEMVEEARREEEGRGAAGEKGFRDRKGAVVNERMSGPQRKRGVYHKKPVSKSLDDLNKRGKQSPIRRDSRDGERTVTITKQEFLSEIKLIGGRGYGIFIETDSRRHRVETGDKILEIGDRVTNGLTRAEVFELLDSSFLKSDSVRLTVFYDAKALSQLPPHAKDNFYVRCIYPYRPTHSILTKNYDLAFEKGDVLHITNTLPTGHTGYWMGEKVGSKGETQGAGLVPISLNSDPGDNRIGNGSPKVSPKYGNKTSSVDAVFRSSSSNRALQLYQPVCQVTVKYPRPVLLLGILQKEFRKHIVSNSSSQDDVKFCFSIPEEASKVHCAEDEIVERLTVDGKPMITTTTHIKDLAREGYHCVLCNDADSLHFPGLQSLTPIVLYLHTSAVRVVNKIRQRLPPHDGDFSAQEEIDYAESLKRYIQYFTGQIDLQVSMVDVVKEIRATVARQQKSVVWENEI